MNKRNYNVFFHLHTVSGIVISVGLYIIFFAGAFTLFEHAIHHWEAGKYEENHHAVVTKPFDYDRLFAVLKKEGYDLYGRNVNLTLEGEQEQGISISGSPDKNATKEAKKRIRLKLNTSTYELSKEGAEKYSFGRLLYLLHFYYQLGKIGYYISGAVALFFLFAIVTGVVIHWEKIVSNFYLFRPFAKLKTVWTDAHTALGTIGLPFQFLYALTGAMFGLGIVVSLSGSLAHGGSTEKFYEVLYGREKDSLGTKNTAAYSLNRYADSLNTKWEGFEPKYITIKNCESTTMQFGAYGFLPTKSQFLSDGELYYDVATGKITKEQNPLDNGYANGVWASVYRLHYADYGELGSWNNYGLKIVYFLLALATCVVIISGVLIWMEARNKKNIPEKEKRYNEGVGHIYLALCLSMLPITAFTFIVSKLLPETFNADRETIFNYVYFGGWLLLSIFFWRKKDNHFTNKYTLLSGAILGLLIPIVNGIHSGNWIWRTFLNGDRDVFVIDALWICISAIAFYSLYRIRKKVVLEE